jgi:hypothetical protein
MPAPAQPRLPDRPFTTEALPALGLTRPQLYRLVEEGLVRRVVTGAFVAAHVPDTTMTRAEAVALVVREHQVVVDRTAAIIHGVDTLAYAELDGVPPLETCALRGHTRTRRPGVEGRERDLLLPVDVMLVGGVRVTSPVRTSLDLGCRLRRREAYAAMCAFARLHRVSADVLQRELARFRGRRGVCQLRSLARLVRADLESAREAWTFLAIADDDLPLPEPQVWIEVDGVPTYRLDFAYRHRKVCVEYDGADAHDRTPEQRAHDRERRDWLRAEGWTVIVVRRGDFTGERLERWLGELRAALDPAGYSTVRW